MGKSYRKTPIFGNTTAESEKWDKRFHNRRYRNRTRIALLRSIMEDTEYLEYHKNEITTTWMFQKDGKHYWSGATKKDMRK